MGRYVFRKRASADLRSISAHSTREWGWPRAQIYLLEIQRVIEWLAAMPEAGASAELVRPGYRKHPAGVHIIYYRLTKDGIEIVRILHQRMDMGRHL